MWCIREEGAACEPADVVLGNLVRGVVVMVVVMMVVDWVAVEVVDGW